MKTKYILFLLICFSIKGYAQNPPIERHYPDSLVPTSAFVVFRGDTFNLKNTTGQINGKGIWLFLDSIVWPVLSLRSHGDVGYWDSVSAEVYYSLREVRFGTYKEGLKTGLWSDVHRGPPHLTVTYVNDIPQGLVTKYYENGKIDLQGEIIPGQDKVKMKHYDLNGVLRETYEYSVKDIWYI